MLVSRFPRVRFSHDPTPLEPLERLSKALGGPRVFVKRDDCTGLATGGNKTRKLEFLVADALGQGCDTLVTVGAVQSNHARQTAAAAARYGLGCEILLERRVPDVSADYERTGNVFLDRLLGARIHYLAQGANPGEAAVEHAEQLLAVGKKPYVIPGGGSNAIGALGYVVCAEEIIVQSRAAGIDVDHVVHATGSGGTQAGLVAGFAAARSPIKVTGISVRFDQAAQEERVYDLAREVHARIDGAGGFLRSDVVAFDEYVGPGYGQPTQGMIEAVQLLAETEGMLLDPVYSGKGMAGLVALCRNGHFGRDDTIVFVHTGGAVSLFAYEEQFN